MFRALFWCVFLCLNLGAARIWAEPGALPTHAVVLIYHHVDDETPASTSVSPDLFERHLEFLDEGGYQVWPLSAIVDSLRSGGSLPDRTVALTFDDGYASVYNEAWPRLQSRGWPFTVFVCTDDIDAGRGPVMTWDQLRTLAGGGATIASHGYRHDHLQRLYPGEDRQAWHERLKSDLLAAQDKLKHEIGEALPLLAYPYGEFDSQVCQLVRDLGWSAFGQQSGPLGVGHDTACLPRFPMAAGFAKLSTLGEKLDSLPLPVLTAHPQDPNLPPTAVQDSTGPILTLTLAEGDYRPEDLVVYVSGQDPGRILSYDSETRNLTVQSRAPLRLGRSRYNLVAPAVEGRRWYWYSHVWIVGDRHKD